MLPPWAPRPPQYSRDGAEANMPKYGRSRMVPRPPRPILKARLPPQEERQKWRRWKSQPSRRQLSFRKGMISPVFGALIVVEQSSFRFRCGGGRGGGYITYAETYGW